MTLSPGSKLGPYEILAPIGAGGMGEVYRARDPRLGRDVAIKVLPASFSSDPDRMRRFEQEARAASALTHPNILTVHDFGTQDGSPYVVSELLDGDTLHAELAGGKLSSRRAIDYSVQIAYGLAAAHDKGIVHRDLKPENLFVTKSGRVKILDFGLAKLILRDVPGAEETSAPTATPATEPGIVMGTVGYMSPEQVRGKAADPRSDIFSFGAILYEMLAGNRAFRGESAADTMSAILREDPPDLAVADQNVPPGLERIVRHCLEKNPERRFHSAHDLAFDLEALSISSGSRPTRSGVEPLSGRALRPALLALAILGAAAVAFFAGTRAALRSRDTTPASFRRLTFRRGNILSARFASDGQTVVYSAAWEGNPAELFTLRMDGTGSRPLGIRDTDILSVSSKGELAVLRGKERTLARIPLGGGSPRDVMEDVDGADWSPDGEALAVASSSGPRRRLEYPIGHVLDETSKDQTPRVSPDGQVVAVIEGIDFRRQAIAIVDRAAKKRELSTGWDEIAGLAWSPRGDELFFVANKTEDDATLRAVDLSGHERVLLPGLSGSYLHDVARDGKILLERSSAHRGILFGSADQERETQLAWLDGSALYDLSADGREIVFSENGEGGGSRGDAYLRRTDGSPPVRLGDGSAISLSPDGKWVLTKTRSSPPELVLLPTGPGTPKKISLPGITRFGARFSPDGRLLVFDAAGASRFRVSIMNVDEGKLREVAAEGFQPSHQFTVSPEGAFFAYATTDHKVRIAPINGGSPVEVPHAVLDPHDKLTQWSADKRSLYFFREGEIPARVWRLGVETGEKVLWKELKPSDASGVTQIDAVLITPDGRSYAYGYHVVDASTLYVVSGLK